MLYKIKASEIAWTSNKTLIVKKSKEVSKEKRIFSNPDI